MNTRDMKKEIPEPYRFIAVLWLSFLMAAVITSVFFAVIDPLELQHCTDISIQNRMTVYSTGFFIFWLITALSSLVTTYFINAKN